MLEGRLDKGEGKWVFKVERLGFIQIIWEVFFHKMAEEEDQIMGDMGS